MTYSMMFVGLFLGLIIGGLAGWWFAMVVFKKVVDDMFKKRRITRNGSTFRLQQISVKSDGREIVLPDR